MILEQINKLNKKFLISSERASDIVGDVCLLFEDHFVGNDFEKWELSRFYDCPSHMEYDEHLLFYLFDEKFLTQYEIELKKIIDCRYN